MLAIARVIQYIFVMAFLVLVGGSVSGLFNDYLFRDTVFRNTPYIVARLVRLVFLAGVAIAATALMAGPGRSWLSYGYSNESGAASRRLLGLGAAYAFVAFGLGGA